MKRKEWTTGVNSTYSLRRNWVEQRSDLNQTVKCVEGTAGMKGVLEVRDELGVINEKMQ